MSTQKTIDDERAKNWRHAWLAAFDQHDELNENEDEVLEDEVFPDAPDDVTLQKVIASYDGVMVWLLNESGPLQAYYVGDEWGEPGDEDEVAAEIEETL
jgi:hypothetical protein